MSKFIFIVQNKGELSKVVIFYCDLAISNEFYLIGGNGKGAPMLISVRNWNGVEKQMRIFTLMHSAKDIEIRAFPAIFLVPSA